MPFRGVANYEHCLSLYCSGLKSKYNCYLFLTLISNQSENLDHVSHQIQKKLPFPPTSWLHPGAIYSSLLPGIFHILIGFPVSTFTILYHMLHSAARVSTSEYESDHVPYLPRKLQWLFISLRKKFTFSTQPTKSSTI